MVKLISYNLLFVLIFISSCHSEYVKNKNNDPIAIKGILEKIDNVKLLYEIFKTDELELDTLGRKLLIKVSKSKSIQAQRQNMGKKWINSEAIVSVAAFNFAYLSMQNFDSITFNIDLVNKSESYSYSAKQLKKSIYYWSICKHFFEVINQKNIDQAISFFSNEIIYSMPKLKLEKYLSTIFIINDKIENIELKGLKVIDDKYDIYFNICYSNNGCQTYGCSFVKADDKIAGLHVINN